MPHARAGLLALLCLSLPMHADDRMPLFDAHIHYSVGATEAYPPDTVMDILDAAGVGRALLSSTPNDGTVTLYGLHPQRFVPFVRPYHRTRDLASWSAERQNWYRDPETLRVIERELERGIYRGIGEFHVDGREVDTKVMRGIVDLAVRRGLWLMAHSDAAAIEKLFAFNPSAKILWAHTGMGEPEAVVARLFETYPALYGELSYRAGIVDGGGLSPAWRDLFLRFPDRFVYGSDTWTPSRWPQVRGLTDFARRWLAELPPDVAEKIAFRNGERLFGAAAE
jgi:hypothetical protein